MIPNPTLEPAVKVTEEDIRNIVARASTSSTLDFVVLYEEFVEKHKLTLDEYQDMIYLIRSRQV